MSSILFFFPLRAWLPPACHRYSIWIFSSRAPWLFQGGKHAGKARKKRNSCLCSAEHSTPANDNNVNEWHRVPRGGSIERQRKMWIRRETFSMEMNDKKKREPKKNVKWKIRGASSLVMVFCEWLVCKLIIHEIVTSCLMYALKRKVNVNVWENKCQTLFILCAVFWFFF